MLASMPHIVTLTFNPALDVSTTTPRVEPAHKLRCSAPVVHPGGGGINVARVLHRLGADVRAVFTAGGPTGTALQALLHDEGVPIEVVPTAEDTRQSFAALSTDTGEEYRFVLPGPRLSDKEQQACMEACLRAQPSLLVASGSLCPGMPTDTYAQLARQCLAHGIKLAVDTSGPALHEALKAGVHLIKPSLRELRELCGCALPDQAAQLQACRQLIADGQAQVIALSLGAEGAMLVSADGAWQAPALPVEVLSTIGAGDSFLAGLVHALSQGEALPQAFTLAVAASAAALSAQGTALCAPEVAQAWRDRVQVHALG